MGRPNQQSDVEVLAHQSLGVPDGRSMMYKGTLFSDIFRDNINNSSPGSSNLVHQASAANKGSKQAGSSPTKDDEKDDARRKRETR